MANCNWYEKDLKDITEYEQEQCKENGQDCDTCPELIIKHKGGLNMFGFELEQLEQLKRLRQLEYEKEIATTRERNITLKLSDADCDRIFTLCGQHGITVAELLENFISDLVAGTYTNGSDERDYAERYFERCWFGMYPEKTLLNYLLSHEGDYDVDGFLRLLKEFEDTKECWEQCQRDSEAEGWAEEDIEWVKNDFEGALENLEEVKTDFLKANPTANWDEEVAKVFEWVEEKEQFVNE